MVVPININYESMILSEGDGAGDSDSDDGDYDGDDVDDYGNCDDADKQSWM